MILQSILYSSIFLLAYISKIYTENSEIVVSRTAVKPCGIGLEFILDLNNTSVRHDCDAEVSADECCLSGEELDCDVLKIIGDCAEFVPRGSTRTVRLVAPILDPINRLGYCVLYIDSKCTHNSLNKRDTIKIDFNTNVENFNKIFETNIKPCQNIDEDPLNDCKPVDCDSFYNNRKPYYNMKLKRCVETPPCITDGISELPNTIYDPISNSCIEGKSINKRDIDFIKKNKARNRHAKDVFIIKAFKDDSDENVTSDDLNDAIDKVPMCSKCKNLHILNPDDEASLRDRSQYDRNTIDNGLKSNIAEQYFTNIIMNYIAANKCSLMVFGGLIFLQCIIIIAMIYCNTKSCRGCKNKKLVRKFFNYRHDASVTTPLIGTSNMDTETDYQFETDSSNVDKKIKCYKACKEKTNAKMSMSDDILNKCLNRRNWSRQQNIPEETTHVDNADDKIEPNKPSTTKVVFEDEKANEKMSKKIGSIPKCLNKEIIDREKEDIEEYKSSEMEIQCHSYNDVSSNITGFQPSSMTKKLGYCTANKIATVDGSEKSVLANFSHDYIDDLISERGIYLADNLSRYTFSTESDPTKTSSPTLSSKTSKNNIFRNFLSRISRKTRTSDPGAKQESSDVKVIHMSERSLYSTSNDYECTKCKGPSNSRTSM